MSTAVRLNALLSINNTHCYRLYRLYIRCWVVDNSTNFSVRFMPSRYRTCRDIKWCCDLPESICLSVRLSRAKRCILGIWFS